MQHHQIPLVSPALGTQRYLEYFHFGKAGQGKKVYIQASLHADEIPGMLVAWKLKQQLIQLEKAGRLQGEVVLVPIANPIGQNQHLMDVHLGRYHLETGQNFNRHYFDTFSDVKAVVESQLSQDPEHNLLLIRDAMHQSLEKWRPTTELGSLQKTLQQLSCDADVMLDLHCDFEAALHLYSTYYSWQGIEPLARLLGSKANLLANETGGAPFDCSVDMVWQRLTECFGDVVPQGCMAATVELRGQANVTHHESDQDSSAILRYLEWLGVIAVASHTSCLPDDVAPSSDLGAVEMLATPCAGILVHHVSPGDWIEAGEVFAEVIDPLCDHVESIRAAQSGYVYSRNGRRIATAGMLIGNVAGCDVIRSGYLLAP
ncbi:MAG: succinylglutamate desuccinylase/aspartoacylase family protein [Vibrio sp.]